MVRRFIHTVAAALLLLLPARAFAGHLSEPLDSLENVNIERIEVRGRRLMRDIGLQHSRLDTTALHDNISLSMGDILMQNANTFIKSYGRGTMATVSMRGTAPSHTQVTWNGMPLNSPMLGMVDFSLIPSYFVDEAGLYRGASSVGIASGGLGGAVTLENRPAQARGPELRFVQGVGSYMTFDEFLRFGYSGERWSTSTRVMYSRSRNDFQYTNYSKLPELEFDDAGNLTGRRYPTERNRNGDYSDLHILQELYFNTRAGDRFGLAAWYVLSSRGVPKLSTDYRDDSHTRAQQDESTLRAVASWDRIVSSVGIGAKAGYAYTDMLYRYMYDLTGTGENMVDGIRSQSYAHTAFAQAEAEYSWHDRLMASARVTANQHFVVSRDESVYGNAGEERIVGYRQARFELSTLASLRYAPIERVGLAASVRWDVYGVKCTPVVPAFFADFVLWPRLNLKLKASITRNFRYPTLNDLYFQPGGNPDLRPERGFTYDGGLSFEITAAGKRVRITGEVSAYDSYIDDWILWRPTFKGFWTPLNIRRVHAYGVESSLGLSADLGRGWQLSLNGMFSMTRSLNQGDAVTENDVSYGMQLPYIPVFTSSAVGRIEWRGWAFIYKWRYYSERYTTSSNDLTVTGVIAPYFMSDISLEKRFSWRWGRLSLRADVNNLFGEEYETVLSHPMPGRNFGFSVGISPDFGRCCRRGR